MTTGRRRAAVSGFSMTSPRVLVIMSNAAAANHLVELLNQALRGSVRLTCADRLSVAMQRLHDETFHLAFLDPALPDARGVEPVGMLLSSNQPCQY